MSAPTASSTAGLLSGFQLDLQVTSQAPVNDGQWHTVALVVDVAIAVDGAYRPSPYLDGQLVGSAQEVSVHPRQLQPDRDRIHRRLAGHSRGLVWLRRPDRRCPGLEHGANGRRDQPGLTTAARGTEPGLEADYPFNDGQGLTVRDLTANHYDGTLAGPGGDLPTWVTARRGDAIDLGGGGITYNSTHHARVPTICRTSPLLSPPPTAGFEGWLGGSTPGESYRIDVFASAGYAAAGRVKPRPISDRWK